MSILNEAYTLSANYNPGWNPHYNFSNEANVKEIAKMAKYDESYGLVYGGKAQPGSAEYEAADAFLKETERAALGGKDGYDIGVVVNSEWGINKVVDFSHENGQDTCIKDITVFPNNMLSLQSHNGRKEKWEVQEGTLSLIMNGALYEVSDAGVFDVTGSERKKITDPAVAAQNEEGRWSITLPEGSIHCMINRSDENARVIETQTGVTREADNKRFADQQRGKAAPRATIPLTSQALYDSALIYWKIEREIASKPGLNWNVSFTPGALSVA